MMANYGEHADCYPYGHPRGGPCSPSCPYARPLLNSSKKQREKVEGKHKGPYKEGY